jgi:hypothetical protein
LGGYQIVQDRSISSAHVPSIIGGVISCDIVADTVRNAVAHGEEVHAPDADNSVRILGKRVGQGPAGAVEDDGLHSMIA